MFEFGKKNADMLFKKKNSPRALFFTFSNYNKFEKRFFLVWFAIECAVVPMHLHVWR